MGMEELIVRHCSPTMAGLKTGNLFNFQAEDAKALASGTRRMNRQFVPRGICLIPVRYRDGAAAAKYTGLWKVYGNVEAARSRFSQFKKCTGAYCEAFRKYHSFDRLIVSCS